MREGKTAAGIFLFLLGVLLLTAPYAAGAEDYDAIKKFFVEKPPFTPGIFPCSQCHEGMPVNRKPRKLEGMHQEITLKHMPGGWCFDCHNPDNRDKLRLANGKLVDFTESYILCGQCHGEILREWKPGLHGKRTGMWNGEKHYLLC
ncbi:MAG: cytochrome c3 family protein, partial [bacterium]